MKPLRVWAVTRKEWTHIRRDPRSLLMGVAMPVVLLLLFGYALTLDVDDVPVVVWDQSRSPESRELVSRFAGSPYFSVQENFGSYGEIEEAIDTGEALAALIIPVDFGSDIGTRRPADVQWILDGSDANTATIAMGYARTVVRSYSLDIVAAEVRRVAGTEPEAPVDLRPRVWFNADMASRNYIIPGLIAVIMMVIAALLTSLTVAREWETGTMEQIISTPLKGPELILGKTIPYFGIGMFDVVVAVLMGEFVFEVPFRGSFAVLFATSTMFLIGALALGMLISIVTKSQLLASQLAMILTFLPSVLLSGFVYYIGNMPAVIQGITYFVPARYFVTLLRGVYLKGVGPEVLLFDAALLVMFSVGIVGFAMLKFRKKMA